MGRKTIIITITVGLGFLLASWLGYYFFIAKGELIVKRPDNFEYEVQFKLDGKEYTTPADIKNILGTHTIYSNPEGTIPYNTALIIKKMEKKTWSLVLNPINPADTTIGNSEPSINASSVFNKASHSNPLMQYLPVFNSIYNFVYDIDLDNGQVSYFIEMDDRDESSMSRTLSDVKGFIKDKGVDPTSIKIVWREKNL